MRLAALDQFRNKAKQHSCWPHSRWDGYSFAFEYLFEAIQNVVVQHYPGHELSGPRTSSAMQEGPRTSATISPMCATASKIRSIWQFIHLAIYSPPRVLPCSHGSAVTGLNYLMKLLLPCYPAPCPGSRSRYLPAARCRSPLRQQRNNRWWQGDINLIP